MCKYPSRFLVSVLRYELLRKLGKEWKRNGKITLTAVKKLGAHVHLDSCTLAWLLIKFIVNLKLTLNLLVGSGFAKAQSNLASYWQEVISPRVLGD